MSDRQQQECPLCGMLAQYILKNRGRAKEYECSSCTYFQISMQAESRILMAGAQSWRDSYAEMARNTPDPEEYVLWIRVPLPSQSIEPGCAEPALVGKYELRSKM
jgi:hypothetical protein